MSWGGYFMVEGAIVKTFRGMKTGSPSHYLLMS
jgi:hypothetical protein